MSDAIAVDEHLRPGAIVAEKYEVERVLGEGGVGIVVAARHIHLNRPVALKFLKPGVVAARERAELFANEARATFDIVNAHIVRVLDLDRLTDNTPFMVMELLEGCDLRKLFDSGEVFTAAAAIELGQQICTGLSAAHSRGVVHRDIKPENIFVVRSDGAARQYKLLDFGISRISRVDATPAIDDLVPLVSGTPGYMSPEQVSSEAELDQRSDIWSLGCVLYEMLAKNAPFHRDVPEDACRAVLLDNPPSLRAACPGLDSRLERIVMRCLSKSASDRFASADELKRALDALPPVASITQLTAATVSIAHHTTANVRVPRRLRRVVSALVGIALGVAAAKYAASLDPPEPQQAAPWPGKARVPEAQSNAAKLEHESERQVATPSAARTAPKRKKPLKSALIVPSPDPDVGF